MQVKNTRLLQKRIWLCVKSLQKKSAQNLDTILEYHNNYGSGKNENNFYDWLMIIPINTSVMTNGFFAGIETNTNRAVVRAYKTVLNELISEVVDKIDNLKETSE